MRWRGKRGWNKESWLPHHGLNLQALSLPYLGPVQPLWGHRYQQGMTLLWDESLGYTIVFN